ncbi:Stk1 family PASTA domain-containing Ser/Thr kinase [Streptomyces sp. A7024]|uniref:non-specific serine/threonine protein kinase n=1 Tax=Streptomyces coryli TaxID=1128680 RepID=A0A6G4TY03_9ACTN|nr:Stk1 family PASTA domain-containing Ser/Thr kinase [Streptomyces coryli]NGN63927.1 Stk1 family PASTA domain-containing Ser/Thr kinase [Streptomyces coryli]
MDEPRRLGGRYELGQVLGRGGMAEVYLAHDTRLGRTVAVKTLRADMARDPSFQARFRREAQSAASLNHPAIVAVYDTGEDYIDGVSIPYIVMEYVDGSTLRELLHSGRKLLPERAMEMTTGILQALEYSHRNGIVHRDIKPANVMLTRTGQVKVMDFGIARAMGDAGVTMTQTAAVIGTAQYLSPEQAKGEQVDARSDLYSTGCLIYELLTNRPPFVGDSPVAVAYQHVREEAQPPSVYDPEITPEMDAIVMKALTKDPDYRYQSADEMRADIDACLDGAPVAAATAAMGAVGYGGDHPTQAMSPQGGYGDRTSMLPPTRDDDGGMGYEGRASRRQPPPKRGGGLSTLLLVLAGILVLVGAIFIGKSLFGGDTPTDGKVSVPNVEGMNRAGAKAELDKAELDMNAKNGTCDKADVNKVTKQSPASGTEVKKGDEVIVTVCTGTKEIVVPSVMGQDFETAKETLEDEGFKVEKKTGAASDTPGQVTAQNPTGNSKAPDGATITLTVSTEQKMVDVPDVTGDDAPAAKKELEEAGFTVTTKDEESAEDVENSVIRQNPAGGQQAKEGATVTIVIARPPQDTTVPDVSGKTLSEARQILTGAGLKVKVQGPTEGNSMVVTTNPAPNSAIKKNQVVTVVTSPGGGDGGEDDGGIFP